MFKSLFGRSSRSQPAPPQRPDRSVPLTACDEGIIFPSCQVSDLLALQGQHRARAAYLLQLEQEGHLQPWENQSLLTWDQLFVLLADPRPCG